MSDKKIIQHSITKGGAVILRTILSAPGWYEGERVSVMTHAASLLEGELEGIKEPKEGSIEEREAWARDKFELPLTDAPRVAVQICLRHFHKKAAFSPSKHVATLMKEFGVE